MHKEEIFKLALTQGCVNGIVSGLKAWFAMRSVDVLPLTLDTISGGRASLMGKSVAAAFAMGLVVTLVTYLNFRKRIAKGAMPGLHVERLRFWPGYVLLAAKNALFVFGLLIMTAVMWQYWVGTVFITPAVAVLITVMIAGVETGYTSYSTMLSMQELALLPEEALAAVASRG